MTEDQWKGRRYTEEEFALILRRASEIQERPSGESRGPRGEGLSLEEIQSIAGEAGIDAKAVARAAALLDTMDWEERSGLAAFLFRHPGKYHLSFEVPGKVSKEEVIRILEVIRRTLEHQGETIEVLGGVQWRTAGELSAINVNISPREDSTSVQIVGDRSGAGAVTFIFPMAGAAILVGALGAIFEPTTAPGIAGLVGGVLGSGFLFARTLWVSGSKKFQKRLSRLMNDLSVATERAALSSGARTSSQEEAEEGSELD